MIASNNDTQGQHLKDVLHPNFKIMDFGDLRFFLGLEITRYSSGIYVCQQKYALQLLADTSLMASKPAYVPIDPLVKLSRDYGQPLSDPSP